MSPAGSQGEKESAVVKREAPAQSESPDDGIFTFPVVTNYYAITHLIINFSNKNFISKIQYYPKNQGRNKNALCSIPTQDHMCSPARQLLPMLQETNEGRYASSRTHHDDGDGGVIRQVERVCCARRDGYLQQ